MADDAMFCPSCGDRVSGPSGYSSSPYGTNYSQQPYGNQQTFKPVDSNNTGFNILSFLFPIVGLILYLVFKDEKPIQATGCGKWALIGFIVGVVLGLIAI